jgi:hypothetical protein
MINITEDNGEQIPTPFPFFLTINGWNVADSNAERIHIQVDKPFGLIRDCHKLKALIESVDVAVGDITPESTDCGIEASYNPCQKFGVITIWNPPVTV